MKLLLVDGHYYAYRSFYAIRELSNSRGEPTNMLYGMAKALRRMIADLRPDFAAVVMDGGLPAHRTAEQSAYKANRSETPELLSKQLPYLEQLVPALGFGYLCVEGEEADDVLASYACAASARGIETILATNDKDLMQLVCNADAATGRGAVRVYQPNKEGYELIDPAAVVTKWGVAPEQIGDILMLTGDAVDNIPGVPGVGPKTAAGWIREFGSVDRLLENLPALKSERHRQMLEAARPQIASNRIMVLLRTELPLPRPIDELPLRPDPARQAELFASYEFKTLLREAQAESGGMRAGGVEKPPAPSAGPLTQGELL